MTKIKVGVIGAGSISMYRHFPEYVANKHVEVVAVCDIVEERAVALADQVGAKAFTDYNELLKMEEIDAVSVCLPNYLHAPVSIAASKAGKHVLVEKPMATSSEEAQAMIDAAAEAGKKLMVGHNQRFVDSHRVAKEIIDSGKIGRVYSFRTAFGHPGPEGWSQDGATSWFFDKERAFVGAMGDLGVHKADLMRYLLGEITEVGSFVTTNAKVNTDVDDNAVCILRTESGVIGTLAASWAYRHTGDNSTVIYGEKGTLFLESDPEFQLIEDYGHGHFVKHKLQGIQTNEEGGQHGSHVVNHFISSILNDTKPLIDGEEGKKSLEVILGALKSQETGTIVKL